MSEPSPTLSKPFLIEEDDELGRALDAMGDGIWSWNLDTGEVFYSDRWIQSLGYERAEVAPTIKFVDAITHPEDRDILNRAGSAHLEGQTDYFECEYRLRTKNGEWRWTRSRGRVLERTSEGHPVRILGVNFDVTAASEAQQAFEESSLHCRAIVETAGCAIICLDTALRITHWNNAAERIYGWTTGEVLGKYYPDWFVPDNVRETALDEMARVLAGGEALDYESPIIARDGSERMLLWNSAHMVDGGGKTSGLVAIAQDITDRKLAERQREIAHRETQVMVERIQTLRGLLPVCSHCRRIQDTEGGWSSFDDYLLRAADVDVSHGLCPICLERTRDAEAHYSKDDG